MNIIAIVLALVLGGLQVGEVDDTTAREVTGTNQMCITAEKVVRPTMSWRVVKTEIKLQNKLPYVEVSVHNPLNRKTPNSVDAKLILSIDPAVPSDPQRYNLVMAVYYNENTTVTFKRIYSVHEIEVGKKKKKFPMQTPCFAREVMQTLQFEPVEVKVPAPDGGTK